MQEVRDIDSINANVENNNTVRYANDIALIADFESKLQHIIDCMSVIY